MDEIVEEYPEIHFSQNEEWKDSGTVLSLFTAPITGDSPVYACYADTVFEEEAVNGLEGTSLAVDQSWQTRYRSRSEESLRRAEKSTMNGGVVTDVGTDIDVEDADAEFTGLFRFDADTVERARALWEAGSVDRDANIPELLRVLVAAGIPMNGVDIGDQWAELETAQDLSRFILDTKANTLRRLRTMVENSTILDQYTFTVEEWRRDPDTVCERIRQSFDGSAVIVRSSALAEDGWEESNAGRFESVLDIPSDDRRKLTAAIEEVVDSYSV
jgi:choline kinase